MISTRIFALCSLALALNGLWPDRTLGQEPPAVVITGVVTSGTPENRLGEEFIGLYGERKRGGGELDTGKTLGLTTASIANEGQGPWGFIA